MQIDEGLLVKFFAYVFGGLTTLLGTLYWYIWKGDRRRLKYLEENSVRRDELKSVVDDVKREFKSDHSQLFDELRANKQEIREDIRDLREALTTKYAGADRRRQ